MHMGGSDKTGDGLANQPRHYQMPGQPLLNRHQVGGVSRNPDGLFVQQQGEHHGQTKREGERDDNPHPTPTLATHPGVPKSPPPHPWSPQLTQCTPAPPFRTIGTMAVEETPTGGCWPRDRTPVGQQAPEELREVMSGAPRGPTLGPCSAKSLYACAQGTQHLVGHH